MHATEAFFKIADNVPEEGLMIIDVNDEFNRRALDQAVESSIRNWSRLGGINPHE